MKAPQSLYLLAAEQDFRLVRGLPTGLIEICHHIADDFPDVHSSFGSELNRSHTSNVSFDVSDRNARRDKERQRFARHAVAALEAEWARGKDDRIILAAGPKMLGDLRDALPKALAAEVTMELPKDLVKIPLHDLSSHLDSLTGV